MKPAALVATSSASSLVWPESPGLQELVDDVIVFGELLRYGLALRAVVATIYTVVRAAGVSSSYSSHRAQQRLPTRSIDPASVWSRL